MHILETVQKLDPGCFMVLSYIEQRRLEAGQTLITGVMSRDLNLSPDQVNSVLMSLTRLGLISLKNEAGGIYILTSQGHFVAHEIRARSY